MKYIDLGLPSGTLWSYTESLKMSDFPYATKLGKIPTQEQWKELFNFVIIEELYLVSTINNNRISIPLYDQRFWTVDNWKCSNGGLLGISLSSYAKNIVAFKTPSWMGSLVRLVK